MSALPRQVPEQALLRPVPSLVVWRVEATAAESPLDDVILFWPACGHASEDGAVLYDRPVCDICD